jgi:hypothetical protein
MGQAGWGIVLLQFYLLIGITVALTYLAHIIPSSALHTTSAFSIGAFKPFTFLPSPYNGMAFILGSFLIGLSTAYLMSRHWGGQGRFWPLSTNGSQNNEKKMKWLVEPIDVLVLYCALLRYERKRLTCASAQSAYRVSIDNPSRCFGIH